MRKIAVVADVIEDGAPASGKGALRVQRRGEADGNYHPTWSPPGSDPKPEPPGKKAEARKLTRVRRLRYFPLRIRDGRPSA